MINMEFVLTQYQRDQNPNYRLSCLPLKARHYDHDPKSLAKTIATPFYYKQGGALQSLLHDGGTSHISNHNQVRYVRGCGTQLRTLNLIIIVSLLEPSPSL